MVISKRKKEFEIWARRFIRELATCETLEEWADLIAENGVSLGECAIHNATEYVTVKIAIREHSERIDRLCHANSLSASSSPEISANIPTTTTESP